MSLTIFAAASPSATASQWLNDLTHKLRRNLEDYGWSITAKKSMAYVVRLVYFQQVYGSTELVLTLRDYKKILVRTISPSGF